MTDDPQEERRARIEAAAYDVLLEKGYKSSTMLAVARRAKASNETLYRWYGDKAGLYAALVARNAEAVRAELDRSTGEGLDALGRIAPRLLVMVTGERAVALNRAAAANVAEDGALGRALARAGRDVVAPLIAARIADAHQAGEIVAPDPVAAADLFIRLLIGDLQIRRAIGAIPPLDDVAAAERAAAAMVLFRRMHAP